jgi:hypothetical protein
MFVSSKGSPAARGPSPEPAGEADRAILVNALNHRGGRSVREVASLLWRRAAAPRGEIEPHFGVVGGQIVARLAGGTLPRVRVTSS